MALCVGRHSNLHLSSKFDLQLYKPGLAHRSLLRNKSTRSGHGRRSAMSIVAASAKPKVAIIGGGVIGLTSALHLLQRFPDAEVTLIAENFAIDTTSEGAAGLWKPFAISGTPAEK